MGDLPGFGQQNPGRGAAGIMVDRDSVVKQVLLGLSPLKEDPKGQIPHSFRAS
nr:hypothetical protein [uncultured Dongia sp.]